MMYTKALQTQLHQNLMQRRLLHYHKHIRHGASNQFAFEVLQILNSSTLQRKDEKASLSSLERCLYILRRDTFKSMRCLGWKPRRLLPRLKRKPKKSHSLLEKCRGCSSEASFLRKTKGHCFPDCCLKNSYSCSVPEAPVSHSMQLNMDNIFMIL